jgi:hypothetical protein
MKAFQTTFIASWEVVISHVRMLGSSSYQSTKWRRRNGRIQAPPLNATAIIHGSHFCPFVCTRSLHFLSYDSWLGYTCRSCDSCRGEGSFFIWQETGKDATLVATKIRSMQNAPVQNLKVQEASESCLLSWSRHLMTSIVTNNTTLWLQVSTSLRVHMSL